MMEVGELANNILGLVRPFLDDLYCQQKPFFKIFLDELYYRDSIWEEPIILQLLSQDKHRDLRTYVVSGDSNQSKLIKKAIMRTIVKNSACATKHKVADWNNPDHDQLTDCADHYQPASYNYSYSLRHH